MGHLPTNLEEVSERATDIRYSSRTRVNMDALQRRHDVRHAINELERLLPPEIRETEQAKRLHAHGCVTEMDIVQLIYRPYTPQGAAKDYEFSRGTMTARWEQGLSDATTTPQAAPWLAPNVAEVGVRVFDVMHDILRRGKPSPQPSAAEADGPSRRPADEPVADGPAVKRAARR